MVVNTQSFYWPATKPEDIDLSKKEVLYIMVSIPKDQAALQRFLALKGYVPFLLTDFDGIELWRFHHPDGPKPL